MPDAFQGRRCADCGKLSVEIGATCPFCGSAGGDAVTLSGRARLVSWTVIRVAPARYASEAPYAIGLLELDEGPRLTARVEGDPDRFSAGQRVIFSALDAARGPLFRVDTYSSAA
jgi:uncharacterized OB-fold protein